MNWPAELRESHPARTKKRGESQRSVFRPGPAQICRLQRETTRDGKIVRQVQYAITSLSPERVSPAKLIELWRNHWGIENRLHWVRDTVWREDRCCVRNPTGDHNLACFRNAAINLLCLADTPNLTAAVRENAYRVDRLLAKPGIFKL